MFFDSNGNEVTVDQIETAFNKGEATLMLRHNGNFGFTESLSLTHRDDDTRGKCSNIWEERWTKKPSNLNEAIAACN